MERNIGKHQLRFTAPDLLELKLVGDFGIAHMDALLDAFEEVHRTHGKFYFLDDLSDGGSFSSDARKRLAERQEHLPALGIAFVGGSLILRSTLGMVVRAFTLMGRLSYPTNFVANREVALEWIAGLRAENARRAG